MANGPQGRPKHVSGQGGDIHKTGSGLGTGPVGSNSGSNQIKHDRPSSGGSSPRRSSGGGGLLKYIIIAVILLVGGGGGLSGLFSGGGTAPTAAPTQANYSNNQNQNQGGVLGNLINFNMAGSGSYSNTAAGSAGNAAGGWAKNKNTGKLNTSVAPGSRAKYTQIKGSGKDTVTLMVYMCGTDLESSYGMATKDLQEMARATIGKNVNLLIYTGGCKQWKTNGISNSKNTLWHMTDGGQLTKLKDETAVAMTDPSTLSSFIKYCAKNYPANRNMLIFWDHGGGSITGYGYDEKFSKSGAMNLTGINRALKDGGIRFDFIGFDACLMATTETALMLGEYADYMIGSEESEPGIGWYYTNWLTNLSKDTSRSTLEIGKDIVDDFVKYCGSQCAGQSATLSVVDLAELALTVPEELKGFATSTSELLKQEEYATVSNARSGAREFAASSKIDQVDLVDLCYGLGTAEAKELANAILGAVKYNKTSSNMTNAYGLSIYFPYKKVSKVDSAVSTFESVGMDDDYLRCIQEFASYETSGQAISGGAASPLSTLLEGYSSGGTTAGSPDMISVILNGLAGGSNSYNVSGLTGLASGFLTSALSGRSLDLDDMSEYLAENRLDPEKLVWTKLPDGSYAMALSQEQWDLVQELKLNLFADDGEGYIDLGLDTVFDLDEYGVLHADYDYSWLAVEGQFAAYYFESCTENEDGTVYSGYVPALLDGERVELILNLAYGADESYEYSVAGFRRVYTEGETEALAKAVEEIPAGSTLELIADYYDYFGDYQDSYRIGEPITVNGALKVEELAIPDTTKISAAYLFTDIYQQEYWSEIQP